MSNVIKGLLGTAIFAVFIAAIVVGSIVFGPIGILGGILAVGASLGLAILIV